MKPWVRLSILLALTVVLSLVASPSFAGPAGGLTFIGFGVVGGTPVTAQYQIDDPDGVLWSSVRHLGGGGGAEVQDHACANPVIREIPIGHMHNHQISWRDCQGFGGRPGVSSLQIWEVNHDAPQEPRQIVVAPPREVGPPSGGH